MICWVWTEHTVQVVINPRSRTKRKLETGNYSWSSVAVTRENGEGISRVGSRKQQNLPPFLKKKKVYDLHTVRKNSCKTTFILKHVTYMHTLIRKTIHFSKILLNITVETGITTLSKAGFHFDPKLGSRSKFVFIPKQPHAIVAFWGRGERSGGGCLEPPLWVQLLGLVCLS